jgi:hypothetical protein
VADLVDRARGVVARYGVADALAWLRQLGDQLDQAEHGANGSRASIAAELATAEAATAVAIRGAVEELPPLGVAGMVLSIERAARRQLFRHVSSGAGGGQRRSIVASLEVRAASWRVRWAR